jgi:hypothetical protein
MVRKWPCHSAPRLPRRHAEHDVIASGQHGDNLAHAGEQRVVVLRAVHAGQRKCGAIGRNQLGLRGRSLGRRQDGERLGQRQADHAQHLHAPGSRQPERAEGMLHGAEDRLLAVDERAVAIEDDKFHGDGVIAEAGGERECGGGSWRGTWRLKRESRHPCARASLTVHDPSQQFD